MARAPRTVIAKECDLSSSSSSSSQEFGLGAAVMGNILAFANAVHSFRSPAAPPHAASLSSLPVKDVCTCADALDAYIALGFQSGGFTLWEQQQHANNNSVMMRELIAETGVSMDTNLLRIVKLVYGGEQQQQGDVNVLFIDAKRPSVLCFYSKTAQMRDDNVMQFQYPIETLCVTPTFALSGVLFENHSAQLFDRHSRILLANIARAVPLSVSSRWYAHGAREAFPSSSSSSSMLLQQQPGGSNNNGNQSMLSVTSHMIATAKNLLSSIAQDCVLVKDSKQNDSIVVKIPHQEGCSFLGFDPSGSLLVSSAQDGQCLFVYELPSGELKFRLERGFSPSTFVHLCWSPCRTLLVGTTTRGTAHVFSLSGNASTASMTKIHHADSAVHYVRFVGNTPTLQICSGAHATVSQHSLSAASTRLELVWELDRELGEPLLHSDSTADASPTVQDNEHKPSTPAATKFFAQPYVPTELPIWRSPGFALMQTNDAFPVQSFTSFPQTQVVTADLDVLTDTEEFNLL